MNHARRPRPTSIPKSPAFEPLEERRLLAVSVNLADVKQVIDGFGASTAWFSGKYTASQQQLIYSTTNGAGQSLLRTRIVPDTTASTWETQYAQQAVAMGARVFSTPWSPPAAWKSNNNVNNGGSLLPSRYQDYANLLAQYVINMRNKSPSVDIYALSLQNEPDLATSYESCQWTAAQFAAFLPYVKNAWVANNLTTKIMMPEQSGWSFGLASTVMADPVLNSYVDIYAAHNYDNGSGPVAGAAGKKLWMTERYDPNASTGSGIDSALWTANQIHTFLADSNANAWNYWWIKAGGTGGILDSNWNAVKRFWSMGNYAKFLRPNWVRVADTDDGTIKASAYKDPASGQMALVMINNSAAPITQTITLAGGYTTNLTPWLTSATLDLAQQSPIASSTDGSTFTYTIPASSVVTLTGTTVASAVTERVPGVVTTGSSTSQIGITWTAVAGATGYTLERSTNNSTWTTLSSTLSSATTSYTDTGLSTNALYYYRVKANNGTLYSNVGYDLTLPAAPTNPTVTYSTTTLNTTINWTASSTASVDYAVDRSTDGGATWTVITAGVSSGTNTYTDSATPDLATVTYRVRAIYGANSSAPTANVSVNTTVLRAPSSLAASVATGTGDVTLTWADNTTTTASASIERSTDNATWTVLTSLANGTTTYVDTTTLENTTYYYRVRNVLASPATNSAYSATVTAAISLNAPSVVTLSHGNSASNAVILGWIDNSAAETAYKVERTANGGTTWSTLTSTLPANTSSYIDATAASGSTYTYRVSATAGVVTSPTVATFAATIAFLPSPWLHADVGTSSTLGASGTASFNSTNSTYTVSGAGTDIWGGSDGFHYVYTAANGDTDLIAKVDSFSGIGGYGKVGLMLRDSLASNSKYLGLYVTPAPQGWIFCEYRTTAGATPSSTGGFKTYNGSTTPNLWLKITRRGNTMTASYSAAVNPTATDWTNVSSQTFTMLGSIQAGLVVCSHNKSTLGSAVFSGVSVTTSLATPTVATAAVASPSPVTGTTATLSVLGADDGGESNLTYTWANTVKPSGSNTPTFSVNGTNTAKVTTATFNRAGAYTFRATITDVGGRTVTSTVNVTVNQTLTAITVTPATTSIAPGATQQFSASAVDQFGVALTSQPTFTWSVPTGGGSVGATGLYTAPQVGGAATVRATSGAVFGNASITVTNAAPTVATPASSLPTTVVGTSANLSVLGADDTGEAGLVYTWATTGVPPAAVTFTANGTNAAKATVATFSKAGTYSFQATILDAGGLSTTSSVTVVVNQTASTLSVSPSPGTIIPGAAQQFTATLLDQFGQAIVGAPVTWSLLSGLGSLSASGLYTAPAVQTVASIRATSGSFSATAPVYVAPASLKADYGFNENAGSTVIDSARGNSGTVVGATFATGRFGTALSFNGTSDRVDLGNPTALNLTGQITLSAWIKPSKISYGSGGFGYIVGRGATSIPETFLRINNGSYEVGSYNGTSFVANSPIPAGDLNNWVFLAGTFDGTAWRLYRNGVQVGSTATTNGSFASTRTWTIGATATPSRWYSGLIDSVRIYDRGLTATEVSDLASLGPVVVTPAAATITSVNANTTGLSVLGGDPDTGTDANLIYTWSAVGSPPAAVGFAANGTNGAKSSTATFSKAGVYNLQVTISDVSGASTTSSVSVTVNQTLTSVSVTPNVASVPKGTTKQFSALAYDQFGDALTVQPTFTWSVPTGGGSVSTSGLYSAPNATGSATVRATTGSLNASANVNIITPPLPVWVTSNSVAAWNPTTAVLDVTGAATLVADPSASGDSPVINVTGPSAQLTINTGPSGARQVRIGQLNLSNGGSVSVASLGAARTATNHYVIVLSASGLSVTGASRLDLSDNDLILRAGGSTGHAAVAALIESGRNGGAWNGAGLVSSRAQSAFASSGYDSTTLGCVLNGDLPNGAYPTFGGLNVDSTDVLVKYTWGGDVDLNGVVDADDYFSIDTGYLVAAPGWWINGDFDRNGVIDADDYFVIDSMYLNQNGVL